MPIFCQKNGHSHENTLLSYHFFQNFHEKPSIVMPLFGQKNVSSVKTTIYYGRKKSIGCFFFCYFSRKNYYSNAHVLKRRPFSKNALLSCPYFVEKTSNLSKTQCSHVIFFKFYMKNSLLSCPYLIKKTSIL